jgi:UDP-glucose:(heptosyl)LPS alpha-1,3-glucosyltransferase
MRIAFVHQRWSLRGGAEKYLVHLVRDLVAKGHQIDLIVQKAEIPVPEGVSLTLIPVIRFPLWLRMLDFDRHVKAVLECGNHQVSMGLAKVAGTDVFRPGGGCHRAYEQRILLELHDSSPVAARIRSLKNNMSIFNLMNRWIEDRIFSGHGRIVAVSHLVAEDMATFYPASTHRTEIILNGRDPRPLDSESRRQARRYLIQSLNLPEKGLFCLCVAANPLLKGFRHVLASLESLPRSFHGQHSPCLILVGAVESRSLRRLVRSTHFAHNVRFIPFMENIDLYYRGADLLLHPSLYDAFANVCLEAQSHGLPVLTSRMNGGAEVYTSGIDGLVVDKPWDHRAIAEMIQSAVEARMLEEIGFRGHSLLLNNTFAHNVRRVEELLAKVVAAGKSSGTVSNSNE